MVTIVEKSNRLAFAYLNPWLAFQSVREDENKSDYR